ncbi:MAG TPA: hypothetical protein VJW20_07900 [Candidatus Angelobacter sp.]|nr:hypothetical protein [Candidatus Angelobacter sp.]
MGNRPTGYWICFGLAVVALIAALMMRSSASDHTRELAKYVGYGAIVLVLIGRFAFRRPAAPTPPMPRD